MLTESHPPISGGDMDHVRRERLRHTLWIFLGLLGVVVLRLLVLQVGKTWDCNETEITAYLGRVELSKPRGRILDQSGNVLATNRQVRSLFADPARIASSSAKFSAKDTAAFLSPILTMAVQDIEALLTASDPSGRRIRHNWVKRYITPEEEAALGDPGKLAKRGLYLREENLRLYPEGQLASHLIGFVNIDQQGQEGVERLMNNKLHGISGERVAWKDGKRLLLPSLTVDYKAPTGGDDVYLTINADIQSSLEKELDTAIIENKAKSGMGILIEPYTGAILAMASRPAFDPNYAKDTPPELRSNRAVLNQFEPGSAFKIVTAAAAIETGRIAPDTFINCEGGAYTFYAGRTIRDVHKMSSVPFWQAFAESSNIAMIKLAAGSLGDATLEDWIHRFGFGAPTSRDFPNESKGTVHPLKKWTKASIVSLPMGQEMAVTMPQLARAFAAIANGGYLTDLYVVEKTAGSDGKTTYRHERRGNNRILSERTAEIMKQLCYGVVRHGTGRYANMPNYRTAGKTGTAQMANPLGGGYLQGQYNTIFAGFAPLTRPRICGVILIESPMIALRYGGYVCGPVFKRVVETALVKMNCPEEPVEAKPEEVPDSVNQEEMEALMASEDAYEMDVDMETLLAPLENLTSEDIEAAGGMVMPNLMGLSKPDAWLVLTDTKIPWTARGAGWVSQQFPAPGTPLKSITLCEIIFAPRDNGAGAATDEKTDGKKKTDKDVKKAKGDTKTAEGSPHEAMAPPNRLMAREAG